KLRMRSARVTSSPMRHVYSPPRSWRSARRTLSHLRRKLAEGTRRSPGHASTLNLKLQATPCRRNYPRPGVIFSANSWNGMPMPESTARSPRSGEQNEMYLSPPVQRSVRLLRHIVEGGPVTSISRTARELGINRTTLLRLLRTLHAERFIEPCSDGNGWRTGVGFIGLAPQVLHSEDIVQISAPALTPLADEL